MTLSQRIYFFLNCIFCIALYYYYYDSTVFDQQSIHIDSLWVIVKFMLIYGSPFIIAHLISNQWSLVKSYGLSISLWLAVYFFEYLTKSDKFTELYPNGYQCLIVAVTVYPGIGISVLIGNFVGVATRMCLGLDYKHEVGDKPQSKHFSWKK